TQHVRNCGPQTFVISRKGGTLLTINNFVYRSNLKFYGKGSDILYWECVQNRSMKCRSRLKTIGDDLYVTNDVHNHEGDVKRIEAARTAGMLLKKKLTELSASDKF
ncbi:pre-mod-mdg4--Z, partial [Drosophila busckii]